MLYNQDSSKSPGPLYFVMPINHNPSSIIIRTLNAYDSTSAVPKRHACYATGIVHLQHGSKPKCRLDTPDVVLAPIVLSRLFLSDGDALPFHPHHRDSIDIILIEPDAERRVVALRPLRQSPLLHYMGRLLNLDKFA